MQEVPPRASRSRIGHRVACASLMMAMLVSALLPAATDARPASGRPGTLISATPMAGAPQGARAWRITYWSTGARSERVRVSGVLIAPTGRVASGGRRVIAWAHGTSGVAERCAPSLSPQFFKLTPGIVEAARLGYVYVATDYPGLGTTGVHPYLVGSAAAHAVLDSVRAVRQVRDAAAGSRFAVWGESQGGHAALFTGEMARSYAPELGLVGIAAAAPPTDLVSNLTGGTDPSIRAFLTGFTTWSWSRYFSIDIATIARPRTADLINRLASNCIDPEAQPKLRTKIGILLLRNALKGVDLGRIEPWAGIARENSAGRALPGGPLLIAQTVQDPIVAPEVTRAFARGVCRRGGRVKWISLPGGEHATTARNSSPATLSWISDRFAGRPAPSDCGRL